MASRSRTRASAFTPASAMQAIENVEYPAVLKPVTGSWGRLLARVHNRDSAEAILEHRQTLGDYNHHIYYVQEYVEKPRARHSRICSRRPDNRRHLPRIQPLDHKHRPRRPWQQIAPVNAALDEICVRAAQAVGGGILAIDLLEDAAGRYVVNEINHTMEFRNSSEPTGVDIAQEAIDFVIEQVGAIA